MRHISRFVRRIEPLLVFAAAAGCFCATAAWLVLINGGAVSFDEMYSAITARLEGPSVLRFFESPTNLFARTFLGWIFYPLNWLQATTDSEAVFRIYTLAGVLIALFCFMRFARHCFGARAAACAGVLFLLCAQFYGTDYSGFATFNWDYQFRIGLLFLSLDWFRTGLLTGKKRWFALSALFYFILLGLYEAFLAFSVLYFLLALACLRPGLSLTDPDCRRRWSRVCLSLAPHAALSVLYLVILYFGRAAFAQNATAFAASYVQIAPDASLASRLQVIGLFWIGNFPLRGYPFGTGALAAFLAVAGPIKWFCLLSVPVAAVAICLLLRALPHISGRALAFTELFCLLGGLLPCLAFGLSSHYLKFVQNGAMTSYGVAYYSYFFWVGALLAPAVALHQFLRERSGLHGKLFCALLALVLVLCGALTQAESWTEAAVLDKKDNQSELFNTLVRSETFAQVPDGAFVYAPAHQGVAYQMETLRDYASYYNEGRQVNFVNDLHYITFSDTTYYLGDDLAQDAEFFGSVNSNFETDSFRVWALAPLANYCLTGHFNSTADNLTVYVNDHYLVMPGGDFCLDLSEYTEGQLSIEVRNPDFTVDMSSLALAPRSAQP